MGTKRSQVEEAGLEPAFPTCAGAPCVRSMPYLPRAVYTMSISLKMSCYRDSTYMQSTQLRNM